jgi:hypothetical protein
MKTNTYLCYLPQSFFERKIFKKKFYRKSKTHFVFNNFFRKSRFYEIMQKNMIEPDRPQTTISRKCIACWIPNIHS